MFLDTITSSDLPGELHQPYRLFRTMTEMLGPRPLPLSRRILVVHNRYRSAMPSGENVVVDKEVAALRDRGIEVRTFFRTSDELQDMGPMSSRLSSLSALTGRSSREAFRDQLNDFEPDIVHLHNPYPLISPLVIDWSHASKVPVVCTIHNFRLRCMNGLFYRNGEICTRCEKLRLPWPGIVHSCYQDSRLGSAVMAGSLSLHHQRWSGVDCFIAVSDFVADRLKGWGIEKQRIVVKPNPVEDPGPPAPLGIGFLFAGRLSQEKGVHLLLDAWEHSGLGSDTRLIIAGDGPLKDFVIERARHDHSIQYVGLVDRTRVAELRRQTAVGVFTSLWFEAHPAVAESFAHGRPVVATNVGALGEIVDASVGWSSEPTVESLATQLRNATDPNESLRRGQTARSRFLDRYEEITVTDQMIRTYESVMSR